MNWVMELATPLTSDPNANIICLGIIRPDSIVTTLKRAVARDPYATFLVLMPYFLFYMIHSVSYNNTVNRNQREATEKEHTIFFEKK